MNTNIPKYQPLEEEYLSLEHFKEMDYFAVENYGLPIELMMENAGLHLARLVASNSPIDHKILIGVGNGNNGGGGLVAARRLQAWGYKVYLDLPMTINKSLPLKQLDRAIKFGVKVGLPSQIHHWVDSYLGFSQRWPLPEKILMAIEKANNSTAIKTSLDLPVGITVELEKPYFKADNVMSLAAPKQILQNLAQTTKIYIADLGIPKEIYHQFHTVFPPYHEAQLFELTRS